MILIGGIDKAASTINQQEVVKKQNPILSRRIQDILLAHELSEGTKDFGQKFKIPMQAIFKKVIYWQIILIIIYSIFGIALIEALSYGWFTNIGSHRVWLGFIIPIILFTRHITILILERSLENLKSSLKELLRGLFVQKLIYLNPIYSGIVSYKAFELGIDEIIIIAKKYYNSLIEMILYMTNLVIYSGYLIYRFTLIEILLITAVLVFRNIAEYKLNINSIELSLESRGLEIEKILKLEEYVNQFDSIQFSHHADYLSSEMENLKSKEDKHTYNKTKYRSLSHAFSSNFYLLALILLTSISKIFGSRADFLDIPLLILTQILVLYSKDKGHFYKYFGLRSLLDTSIKSTENIFCSFERENYGRSKTEQNKSNFDQMSPSIIAENIEFGRLDLDECYLKVEQYLANYGQSLMREQGAKLHPTAQSSIRSKHREKFKTIARRSPINTQRGKKGQQESLKHEEKRSEIAQQKTIQKSPLKFQKMIKSPIGSGRLEISDSFNSGSKRGEKVYLKKVSLRSNMMKSITDFKVKIENDSRRISQLQENLTYLTKSRRGQKDVIEIDGRRIKARIETVQLDLLIDKAQTVCLMGSSQSGIESFLNGIIGDRYLLLGNLKIEGTISFYKYDEHLFLEEQSIRENIIFGNKYRALEYSSILELLNLNLDKYPEGDRTIIFHNGCNLDPADRVKLLLARFVYQDCDIYIFCGELDLLSNTEKYSIMKRLVKGHLIEKTVVFKSNEHIFLDLADYVYVFSNGSIIASGTLATLKKTKNEEFWSLLTKKYLNEEICEVKASDLIFKMLRDQGKTDDYLNWKSSVSDKSKSKLYLERIRNTALLEENSQMFRKMVNYIAEDAIHEPVMNTNKHLLRPRFIVGFFGELLTELGVVIGILASIYGVQSESSIIYWTCLGGFCIFIFIAKAAVYFYADRSMRRFFTMLHKDIIVGFEQVNAFTYWLEFNQRSATHLVENQKELERDFPDLLYKKVKSLSKVCIYSIWVICYFFPVSALVGGCLIVIIFFTFWISRKGHTHSLSSYVKTMLDLDEVFASGFNLLPYLRSTGRLSSFEMAIIEYTRKSDRATSKIYSSLIFYAAVKSSTIGMIALLCILPALFYKIGLESEIDSLRKVVLIISILGYESILDLVFSSGRISIAFTKLSTLLRFKSKYSKSVDSNFNTEGSLSVESIVFEGINLRIGAKQILDSINLRVQYGEKLCIISGEKSGAFMIFELLNNGSFFFSQSKRGDKLDNKLRWKRISILGVEISPSERPCLPSYIYHISENPFFRAGTLEDNICKEKTGDDIIRIMSALRIIELLPFMYSKIENPLDEYNLLSNEREFFESLSLRSTKCLNQKLYYTKESINSQHFDRRRSAPNRMFLKALMNLYERNILNQEKMIYNPNTISIKDDVVKDRSHGIIPIDKSLSGILQNRIPSTGEKSKNSIVHPFDTPTIKEEDLNNIGQSFDEEKTAEIYILEDLLKYRACYEGNNIPKMLKIALDIVRAILCNPKILLVDTAALDYLECNDHSHIIDVISNELPNTNLILITDNIDYLTQFERVLLIENGAIVEDGKPQDLYLRPRSKIRKRIKDSPKTESFFKHFLAEKVPRLSSNRSGDFLPSLLPRERTIIDINSPPHIPRMNVLSSNRMMLGALHHHVELTDTMRNTSRMQQKRLVDDSHLLSASRMNVAVGESLLSKGGNFRLIN